MDHGQIMVEDLDMMLVKKQFHVLSVSNSQSSQASKSPGELNPAFFPES